MPDVIHALTAMLFAALIAFTATPASMVFAHKIGAIDVPKDNRRMHNHPIPRIGGVSIYFAFALTVLLFCGINRTVVTILIGGLIIAVMGVVDDVKDLPALLKLAVQVGVAAVTVGVGFRIQFLSFGETYIIFPAWLAYTYRKDLKKAAQFAERVLDVEPGASQEETALKGVAAIRAFFREVGLPASLKEVGVRPEDHEEYARRAFATAGMDRLGGVSKLDFNDVLAVYRLAE